jgi:hypothetical protein
VFSSGEILSSDGESCHSSPMNEAPPEAEQTEPHDPESAHGGHGLRWFLWPLLVLACYVLSVGPMVKLAPSSGKFLNVMEFVYTPLLVYAEKLKPVHVFLRWYIEDL